MKKTRVLALLVSLMMLATMAFAESTDDPVVVKVGDVEVRLSEAQALYDEYYQQYVVLYQQYGMAFSDEDALLLRDDIVEYLVQIAVMDNKIAEYGLGDISDEDKQTLREEVEASFEESLAAYAESLGVSVEEARETASAEGITVDYVYEQNLLNLPYIRLEEHALKDITVSDEDVKAEYDAYVEEDKALYENDAASYEMYATYYGAQDIYYVPAGFRYVKHILLATPETIAAELTDIDADISDSSGIISALMEELDSLSAAEEGGEGEASADATAPAADPERTADVINAEIAAEQANYDALEARYQEVREQILPALQPTIDEISQKLADGASFDDLIVEYNTDPGMATSPDGYSVHKDSVTWIAAFRDAAMALENVGDISEPVLTEYGVHILQYVGDVPSGPVPMTDEIAEGLRDSILVSLQDEAYNTAYESWMSDYEVETHPELIQVPSGAEATEGGADETQTPEPEETDVPNEDGTVG